MTALTGAHFLLTYKCNFECDHCFLYSGPHAQGTFTIEEIRRALDELVELGTIETVCFEGGEPFLYYPLMVEGIREARARGFEAGIVTNAYWATALEDAGLWLKDLRELGLSKLSVSDDPLHFGDVEETPAARARAAAEKLGISAGALSTESPSVEKDGEGNPAVKGGVMFRGRAVEKLSAGLPGRNWEEFSECTRENLRDPGRVHLGPLGNVHLCQGLSMGNMWETPLSALVREYDAETHPVCGPLVRGGPAGLAREYGVEHGKSYIDECHLCFDVRRALLERFPQYLAPRQVYGLDGS